MKLSEFPWTIQQVPYSANSDPCPETLAKLRENKRERSNREHYLREVCRHMGTLAINLGCVLEPPGTFKNSQMPRLHPRPIKSGFGRDGTRTSELFLKAPQVIPITLSDQALSQLLAFRKVMKRTRKRKHVISPSEIVWLWVYNLIPDCQIKILAQLCSFLLHWKNGAIILL